ncbi:RNA polymerase sigma factor [Cytobacillus sp. IB215665]|uniref:RNA polymerase sigma factor n=1 Tax=Cytobacillus sp. IB215665 TaxID=3097357 RepID=UPI002A10BCC3|nr:RNA polymerase sigma factor [Cytobacillus sp. IB215665]MDX8365161.1 RNA polymerase sigma factor [Cytobacillus sp. IB215665]
MPRNNNVEILRLYDQYSSRILKFIFVLTKDYYASEDLTQDTFIKASKSLSQLKNKEKIETWLFQIAHNITMDYIRRKKFNVLEQLIPLSREKEINPSTERAIIITENCKELYDALSKLKPTYRKIITLRKIEELSITETSKVLGWSESKVKSTLSRAIKALRAELEKGGYIYEQSS